MVKQLIHRLRYLQFSLSFARKILSLYYQEGQIYHIPIGPIRSKCLRYHKTLNFHVMLGVEELKTLVTLDRIIKSFYTKQQIIIADVGAYIGIMSLLFDKLVSPNGKVYAFEPSPYNLTKLHDHLSINQVENIIVVEKACTDKVGTADFFIGKHDSESSLNVRLANSNRSDERITVVTTTLDSFFYDEYHPLPDLIKMDIEGGAIFALKGCHRLLSEKRPLLFIESHTPDEDRAISEVILKYDYVCYRVTNNEWVTQPQEVHPHPDGVWGTMLLCPVDTKNQIMQILSS